jgi:hypothetical protein
VLVEYDPVSGTDFGRLPSWKKRFIGVGRFPQLTIGSLWLNGEKVDSPKYVRKTISVSSVGRKISAGFSEKVDE